MKALLSACMLVFALLLSAFCAEPAPHLHLDGDAREASRALLHARLKIPATLSAILEADGKRRRGKEMIP